MTLQRPVLTKFDRVIKRLFSIVSVYLIGGTWRTGKTDFSLLLSERLLDIGSVSKVATNINTFGHYAQITDIFTLKRWLHEDKRRKLFIFDEANKHLPSRRAMSNKSVSIISILPEISKAKGRMLVIGQNLQRIDKEYKDTTWIRGVFEKLNRKTVRIVSPLLRQSHVFRDVPRTRIRFDPDTLAPFKEKPDLQVLANPRFEKAYRWCHGASWKQVYDHPMQASRNNRYVMRHLFDELYSHLHIERGEAESGTQGE